MTDSRKIASLVSLLSVVLFCSFNSPEASGENLSDQMDARVRSASEIIDQCQSFAKKANEFHQLIQLQVADAKRLEGEAQVIQTKTPTAGAMQPMKAADYKAATRQFSSDLNVFQAHAQAYQAHLHQLQATIGECQVNQQALAGILHKYELHVGQFHMPKIPSSIKPPHICGRMEGMVGNSVSVGNGIMYDYLRALRSEQDLNKEEMSLQHEEAITPIVQKKAVNQALREQSEQQILAEFGRLKEEYDLLQIENDRLASGKAQAIKVTQASVSGKVKGH